MHSIRKVVNRGFYISITEGFDESYSSLIDQLSKPAITWWPWAPLDDSATGWMGWLDCWCKQGDLEWEKTSRQDNLDYMPIQNFLFQFFPVIDSRLRYAMSTAFPGILKMPVWEDLPCRKSTTKYAWASESIKWNRSLEFDVLEVDFWSILFMKQQKKCMQQYFYRFYSGWEPVRTIGPNERTWQPVFEAILFWLGIIPGADTWAERVVCI